MLFTYRVTSQAGNKVLCAGGLHAADANDALLLAIKTCQLKVVDQYYSNDSLLAGCIYRTDFYMNGKRVWISISPDATQYRNQIEHEVIRGA